jgi:hypothetical protein
MEIREKCAYHVTRRAFNFGCSVDVDEPSSACPFVRSSVRLLLLHTSNLPDLLQGEIGFVAYVP